MTKLLKLFLILFSVSMVSPAFADEKPSGTTAPKEKRTNRTIPMASSSTIGLKSPSRLFLDIEIGEAGIVIAPAEWYAEMMVTVTCNETGESWSDFIGADNQAIEFDGGEGVYTIHCITTDGRDLYGQFDI